VTAWRVERAQCSVVTRRLLGRPKTVRELDPELALRTGTFDARALLVTWCYRKAWFPLL
jgi:hypothetical protein